MTANDWKPTERATIAHAWNLLASFCDSTNHSDKITLSDALKAERRNVNDIWFAKCRVLEHYFKGYSTPNAPLALIYWIRPALQSAQLLGVSHAIERTDRDMSELLEACQLARTAYEASETRRRARPIMELVR